MGRGQINQSAPQAYRSGQLLSYVSALGLIAALVTTILIHLPPFWAMGAGTILAGLCASVRSRRAGTELSMSHLLRFASGGLGRVKNVVILVLLVNMMTAAWFSSGTIQGLVYYGVSLVDPRHVILAGLLLSAILSTLIGSSVGTVATVGVAVMGIARAFNLPPAPVAGAIMSGAIFGDRVSFLSGIFHLTVDMTGADLRKASRRLLASGIPALVVCIVAAAVMGFTVKASSDGAGLAWKTQFLTGLTEMARITPWVLIPPVLVVVLASRRVPVRLCMVAGLVAGGAIAIFYQHESLLTLLRSVLLGYTPGGGARPEVAQVFHSGGLRGTTNMALMLLFAGMYTGIMESSGMMDDISGGLVNKLQNRVSFLLGAMGISVLSTAIASNQAMSVIIPGRAMTAKRQELGISAEDFAGVLADSGVPAAGIIPWNVMAAMCGEALQVSPAAFAPYTVIVYTLAIVGALIALGKKPGYSRAT